MVWPFALGDYQAICGEKVTIEKLEMICSPPGPQFKGYIL